MTRSGQASGRRSGLGYGGDRLDRLAKAHLVADDHPPLDQREAGTEGLVAAKRHPGERLVELLLVHPRDDLRRQETFGGGYVQAEIDDLAQQTVVVGGPVCEVAPGLPSTGRC